jgi:hypothetical protein
MKMNNLMKMKINKTIMNKIKAKNKMLWEEILKIKMIFHNLLMIKTKNLIN